MRSPSSIRVREDCRRYKMPSLNRIGSKQTKRVGHVLHDCQACRHYAHLFRPDLLFTEFAGVSSQCLVIVLDFLHGYRLDHFLLHFSDSGPEPFWWEALRHGASAFLLLSSCKPSLPASNFKYVSFLSCSVPVMTKASPCLALLLIHQVVQLPMLLEPCAQSYQVRLPYCTM